MNVDRETDDRLLDSLIAETQGHEPDPDLAERTLAALADAEAPSLTPESSRGSWLAAAIVLFAVSVVTVVAYGNGSDPSEPPRPAQPQPQDPQDPQDSPPQNIAASIADLGSADEAVANRAAAALLRAGATAVPALMATLADEQAPRGRALEVLDAMRGAGAPAVESIAELILALPRDHTVLGPAFRAAATLAPFADEVAQKAAHRALITVAMLREGPAAGPAAGPAGGGGAAVGGPAKRRTWSMREVARLLHRLRVDPSATAHEWIQNLKSDSPYEREFAADLLGTAAGDLAIRALRGAIDDDHPDWADTDWTLDGFRGNFGYKLEHNAVIRAAAARSLVRIARGRPEAAKGWAYLLEHGNLAEQQQAAAAVGRAGTLPEDRAAILTALEQALDHAEASVVRETITAIAVVGSSTAKIRARLIELTKHGDAQIASRAGATMRALER